MDSEMGGDGGGGGGGGGTDNLVGPTGSITVAFNADDASSWSSDCFRPSFTYSRGYWDEYKKTIFTNHKQDCSLTLITTSLNLFNILNRVVSSYIGSVLSIS